MGANLRIEEAKMTLSRFKDWDDELDYFFSALEQLDLADRGAFTAWVFQFLKGYIATRKEAGLLVIREDPDTGWRIISELTVSPDPDDRDTASEVIRELHDPKGDIFVRQLLNDPYSYIRLDACGYLLQKYPEQVIPVLQELLSDDLEWVRKDAKNLLTGLSPDFTI